MFNVPEVMRRAARIKRRIQIEEMPKIMRLREGDRITERDLMLTINAKSEDYSE